MKRASSGLFLLAAIIAAMILINRLGIFKRSAPPTPPPLVWPHGSHLHNPSVLIAAPSFAIHHASQPRPVKNAPSLSPAEVTQVLNDWTYPGAAINRNMPVGPDSSKKSAVISNTRILVAYAPQIDVWRFYADKAASAVPQNPASAAPAIPSAAGISVSRYNGSAKDYFVTAILFHQNGTDHTQITLQVVPREPGQP